MSHALARIAIEGKLFTWAKANQTQFLGQMAKWDEKVQGPLPSPYLRGYLLPASARTECLQGDEITYLGLYQVSIISKPEDKPSLAESIASSIQQLFPVDSDIGIEAFNGSITDAVDQGPTIVEDSRYNVPVTIPYRGVVST